MEWLFNFCRSCWMSGYCKDHSRSASPRNPAFSIKTDIYCHLSNELFRFDRCSLTRFMKICLHTPSQLYDYIFENRKIHFLKTFLPSILCISTLSFLYVAFHGTACFYDVRLCRLSGEKTRTGCVYILIMKRNPMNYSNISNTS